MPSQPPSEVKSLAVAAPPSTHPSLRTVPHSAERTLENLELPTIAVALGRSGAVSEQGQV